MDPKELRLGLGLRLGLKLVLGLVLHVINVSYIIRATNFLPFKFMHD